MTPSFEQARPLLHELAHLNLNAKRVMQVTHRLGKERCQERDQQVQQYHQKTLVQRKSKPRDVTPPAVAVVGVDGGRLQVRGQPDDEDQADEQHRGKHWREDKIGLLMSMTSEEHETDPASEVPTTFLQPSRVEKLTRQLKTRRAPQEKETERTTVATEGTTAPELGKQEARKPPKVIAKNHVATRRSWADLGPMVATMAWSLGFYQAPRRAFLGDGAECNWTMHRERFSSFTAILDIIHALSYVYAAALAGDTLATGWERYLRWITWVWKGEVARVIEELLQRQGELGTPTEEEGETHPRRVIERSLGYLQNHQDKMKYDEYRRLGLPITSSYVESAVKQFNQRVKGTEKFWTEEGAEAILQLRADFLSDRKPLDQFWKTRLSTRTGQRLLQAA